MNFELYPRTVFLTIAGSRSYGTFTENSDWDYRGIAIPPLDSYLGLGPRFEQAADTDKSKWVWKHFPANLVKPESDMQVMDLCKFANLALDNNPSVIEILFTDPKHHIINLPIMQKLFDNRQIFLSKRVKARFCGYAFSQLDRIKRHKYWLDNPPIAPPKRSDFGLPEYKSISIDQIGAAQSLIKKRIDEFMIDQDDLPEHVKINLNNGIYKMVRAVWEGLHTEPFPVGRGKEFRTLEDVLFEKVVQEQGFSENFIEFLRIEQKYRLAKKEWDAFITWQNTRNPERAELEKKHGFDCKHASHLVRLLRMCREILETGQILVERPDASELKDMRTGKKIPAFNDLIAWAEAEDISLQEVAKKSSLPSNPDFDIICKIIFGMVMEFNKAKPALYEERFEKWWKSQCGNEINENS